MLLAQVSFVNGPRGEKEGGGDRGRRRRGRVGRERTRERRQDQEAASMRAGGWKGGQARIRFSRIDKRLQLYERCVLPPRRK